VKVKVMTLPTVARRLGAKMGAKMGAALLVLAFGAAGWGAAFAESASSRAA
jgi:hypothetical protein